MAAISFKFKEKHAWFNRIDPISKLIWVFCIFGFCVINVLAIPQVVMLIIVVLIALVGAKMTFKEVKTILFMLIALLLAWSFIAPLVRPYGEKQLFTINLFGLLIPFSEQGFIYGISMGMRFFTIGFAALSFVITTHPADFSQALSKIIPYRLAQTIVLGLVLWPSIEGEFEVINRARKMRAVGIKPSIMERISGMFKAIFLHLARSIGKAQWVALAMDSRGFGAYPKKTFLRDLKYPISGLIFRYGWIIGLIGYAIVTFLILKINPWGGTYGWGFQMFPGQGG